MPLSTKNARSIPSAGRRTNVATSGPPIEPAVFASSSQALRRVAFAIAWPKASASVVRSTPDNTAVGPVNTTASQTTCRQSAIWLPSVRLANRRYDTATAQLERNATAGTATETGPSRNARVDARSPPAPIPARTTASMTLSGCVVVSTYIDRKRNQITSSAMNAPPASAAQASSRHSMGTVAVAGTAGVIVTIGAGDGGTSSASVAATTLRRSAAQAVPVTPTALIRKSSAASTPLTAPTVFQP